MEITKPTVQNFLKKILAKEIVLPAIQRDFVWQGDQIELLFDSIMREYPIGTILLWALTKEDDISQYQFYNFTLNYHERDYKIDKMNKPFPNNEVMVTLDGQQRLTALNIGLQGSYAYKTRYKKWEDDSAFPVRELYLNLLNKKDFNETGFVYEFAFLEESESKKQDEDTLWYKVKEIMTWDNNEYVEDAFEQILNSIQDSSLKNYVSSNVKSIKKILGKLYRVICENEMSYQVITNKNSEEILDIFVRINDGGTPLSKTDLLLSTTILYWEKAKDEFENVVKSLNKIGQKFDYNKDVIMKSCLALLDKSVVFKIESFNETTVNDIKSNWEKIKKTLTETTKLLNDLGYCKDNIKAYNAIVPIAYYMYNNSNKVDDSEKETIRRYFALSMLRRVFGGSSDNTINKMVKILKTQNSLEAVMKDNDFKEKYIITDEILEEFVNTKKGEYSFVLLTLLYPNFKYSQIEFHQDHMHPKSKFTDKILADNQIDPAKWGDWKYQKDLLPNLQIMEGRENEKKQGTFLKEWLASENKSEDVFKEANYIDNNISLDFKDFELFYENRKTKLKQKLKELLS